jgi:tetratricopeptide (TPR) repeat protein
MRAPKRPFHDTRPLRRPARSLRRGSSRLLLLVFLFPCLGGAQQAAPQNYDRYHAEENVDVGVFYLKRGRYDAAISRFKEALRDQPDNTDALLHLGEAYEKKGDPAAAIKNYRKYVHLVPYAKDARKIRERIKKLSRQERKRSAKPPRTSRSGRPGFLTRSEGIQD